MSHELTMDGLIRALRWRLHDIAESLEHGERRAEPGQRPRNEARDRDAEGGSDDVAGA